MKHFGDGTNALDELTRLIQERMDKAKNEIISRHRGAGQRASGRTERSIQPEIVRDGNSLRATLWGRQFFQGLETGRRGGNVPRGFYSIIRQWSIDKGIPFKNNSQRNTFAYFVANKIAAEGTLLNRQGGRDDIYSPVIRSVMADIEEYIGYFMEAQFKTIKLNDKGGTN